ncbi:hypothetical protein C8D87_11446 [Lentzea atacamensis]|uniref:ANTAR domain-containing protein n=2 Tax=Lentzea atacamensis TaxID=531938 RepID=A0ABX9DYD0_9PSEU|nr:hypothetical protein C8D87_11446 [Lentzea atacamensis]
MTETVTEHQHTGAGTVADAFLHAALAHGVPGDRDNASAIVIALTRDPLASAASIRS